MLAEPLSQYQLEGILLSALQTPRLPFPSSFLGPITTDSAPSLTILIHLQRSEASTANIQLVPLDAHACLSDISEFENRCCGRFTELLQYAILQVCERLLCLGFRCEIPGDGDGEDGAGS